MGQRVGITLHHYTNTRSHTRNWRRRIVGKCLQPLVTIRRFRIANVLDLLIFNSDHFSRLCSFRLCLLRFFFFSGFSHSCNNIPVIYSIIPHSACEWVLCAMECCVITIIIFKFSSGRFYYSLSLSFALILLFSVPSYHSFIHLKIIIIIIKKNVIPKMIEHYQKPYSQFSGPCEDWS